MSKIAQDHLTRTAYVYVRQSSFLVAPRAARELGEPRRHAPPWHFAASGVIMEELPPHHP